MSLYFLSDREFPVGQGGQRMAHHSPFLLTEEETKCQTISKVLTSKELNNNYIKKKLYS